MEQAFFAPTMSSKLYKEIAIYTGTLIGGPLVTGYLMAENFRNLGEENKAKKTWIISVVTTIILFGSIFVLPDSVTIPSTIIPLIYVLIAYYFVHKFQSAKIKQHIDNGGLSYSVWRAALIGFIGLFLILTVVLVVAVIIASFMP